MVYVCDPSTQEMGAEDHKFKVTLSYKASSAGLHESLFKKKKRKNKRLKVKVEFMCWRHIIT